MGPKSDTVSADSEIRHETRISRGAVTGETDGTVGHDREQDRAVRRSHVLVTH